MNGANVKKLIKTIFSVFVFIEQCGVGKHGNKCCRHPSQQETSVRKLVNTSSEHTIYRDKGFKVKIQ